MSNRSCPKTTDGRGHPPPDDRYKIVVSHGFRRFKNEFFFELSTNARISIRNSSRA